MPRKTNKAPGLASNPPGGPMEIVFSFDTTASMYKCIEEVRTKLGDLIKRLQADIPGIRIGVFAHGDYCEEGKASSYVTKHVDFTDNVRKLCNFVKNVKPTSGGGDWEECYELVMWEVQRLSWTPGTQRVLVMIGDDVAHEPDNPLNKRKIDWRVEVEHLKAMEVKIYGVQCSDDEEEVKPFYVAMSDKTGGHYLKLEDFGNIFDFLMAICYRESGGEFLNLYEKEVRARNVNSPGVHKDLEQLFGTLRKDNDASTPTCTAATKTARASTKIGRNLTKTGNTATTTGRITKNKGCASAKKVRTTNKTASAAVKKASAKATTVRHLAETVRATAKTKRATAKTARATTKTVRDLAQTVRAMVKTTRATAKTARATAKTVGESAETVCDSVQKAIVTDLARRPKAMTARGTLQARSNLKTPLAAKKMRTRVPKATMTLTIKQRRKISLNRPALKRENVPETNFRYNDLKWCPWRIAITAKPSASDSLFEKRAGDGNGYRVKRLFMSKSNKPALYEISVQPRQRSKRYVVFKKFSKGFINPKCWENALLGQNHIKAQISDVLHKNPNCNIFVRRVVLRSSSKHALCTTHCPQYDYAWEHVLNGRKCHRSVVKSNITISDDNF